MKALVYTGTQMSEIRDVDVPVVGDNQVLVDLAFCGICGSDMHAWHGHDERRVPPLVLGHEAVGIVLTGPLAGKRVAINPLMTCGDCDFCSSGDEHLCASRELIGMRVPGAFAEKLAATGIDIEETARGIRVSRKNGRVRAVDVETAPFPGFPTDLQAQMMALMCTAEGTSVLEERIFENRFMHAPELMRMGADIDVHGGTAKVTGVNRLKGAPVMATDLRASVSLILAGLAAEGETRVSRVYHLDRGYEHVVGKLSGVGANIQRVPGE